MLGVLNASIATTPNGTVPKQPRPKFAPSGHGAVGDEPHQGGKYQGANKARGTYDDGGLIRRNAKHVGVEERQECYQRLEDQISGQIPQAVADLFGHGQFLR
jgi:hypothetical protein